MDFATIHSMGHLEKGDDGPEVPCCRCLFLLQVRNKTDPLWLMVGISCTATQAVYAHDVVACSVAQVVAFPIWEGLSSMKATVTFESATGPWASFSTAICEKCFLYALEAFEGGKEAFPACHFLRELRSPAVDLAQYRSILYAT